MEYKEGYTLDPTMNVEEFKERFQKKIRKYDIVRLNAIFYKYPTQEDNYKIYSISEVDDYGRKIKNICIIKGVNSDHARLRASLIFNDMEIFTTGFYMSELLSDKQISRMIDEELNNIKKIENKIKQLKVPL